MQGVKVLQRNKDTISTYKLNICAITSRKNPWNTQRKININANACETGL